MKKIIYGLFLFLPLVVTAAPSDIVITEIGAYKAADHEWIEIYNRGSAPIDITGWKFFEDETNHKLTAYRGDLIIESGEFAIIADVASNFEIDYPNFKGTIIDSSWTILKESGEPVALKDASGTVRESFTYIPAGNGSLERADFNLPDYSAGNWKENSSGDTAGLMNSSAPLSSEPATNLSPLTPETIPAPRPQAVAAPVYGPGSLVINEFVSDPGDDAVEWVEIMNKSEVVINLAGWILEDALGKIFELTGELLPQGFRVFELTASRLNNNGDQIKLFDARGALIDSVTYGNFDDAKILDNAPKARSPNSVVRGASGLDTDEDNKNFFITTTPTPGGLDNITIVIAQDEEIIEEDPPVGGLNTSSDANQKLNALEENKDKDKSSLKDNSASSYIKVQGVVSVPPGVLGSQIFYIETSDGGREIYMFKKDFPKLAVGDNVQVQGIESVASAGQRIKVKTKDDIVILGKNTSPLTARAMSIEDITDDDVASLIKMSGEIIESKGKNKFVIADDTGEFLIYIKPTLGAVNFDYVLGDKITATGVVGKTTGGWRLMPRWSSDLTNNSNRTIYNSEPVLPEQPISLGKNRARGIVFGSLGVSGLGALFLGIKFKDKVLPRRRKRHETQEETIDLDKYE